MKRITLAALLALGIHGFLLGLKFDLLQIISSERPKPRVMSISLVPRQPSETTPKAAPSKPNHKTKKHPVVKKIKKKPKLFPKPKPKKVIKEVIQKPEKDRSKENSEKTFEVTKTPDLLEQTQTKSAFKDTDTEVATLSGEQIIREARPLYRLNPPPKYPAVARRRGFQGNVVLEVLVGPVGNVIELHVLSSSGYPILDRAAKSSVKNWTFEPGMRGQKKVEMWVRVPIRFELK
ncbi:MAG: energy transducer TonB [Desulfobacterales bacterium]